MRYLDGELSPRDARELEKRIATSAQARGQVEALAQLRDVVRSRYTAAEEDAGPALDAMWSRLESEIAEPPAPAQVRRRGVLAALGDLVASYRSHIVTAGLAAAAGVLVGVLVTRGTRPGLSSGAARPERAVVESLEVTEGTGTIFQIPAENGHTATTVIWVTHELPVTGTEGPI